jgi:bifunctional DNA-binding transcriptional regulator/antitoxin component of YhaV-PrlF toxin-antitoxin module
MATRASTKELGKARVKAKKQVTIPDSVMGLLGLKEGGEIRFRAKGQTVYIEPVKTITAPADEAYAFTPEWQAQIRESLRQVGAGEVYRLTADEILPLIAKLKRQGKL